MPILTLTDPTLDQVIQLVEKSEYKIPVYTRYAIPLTLRSLADLGLRPKYVTYVDQGFLQLTYTLPDDPNPLQPRYGVAINFWIADPNMDLDPDQDPDQGETTAPKRVSLVRFHRPLDKVTLWDFPSNLCITDLVSELVDHTEVLMRGTP